MSVFTMKLKDALLREGGDWVEVGDVTKLIKPELIGLGTYPIFDESHREVLNSHIFNEYMNHEIGLETVSMFRQAVRHKLSLNMPMYNELYETQLVDFDPLSTVDLTTTSSGSMDSESANTGTADSEATATSGTRVVNQEFPQHALKGDADYASNAADTQAYTDNDGLSTTSGESQEHQEQASTSNTKGYQGSAADLIARRRAIIINVDAMVVDSLRDCFMSVWEVPGAYITHQRGYYYG